MCGIAGIIGKTTQKCIARKMLDAIKHRGPDDEGIFLEKDIFLGHRRLSVIDLSDAGHQPMTFQSVTIVFNGEIYNYIELREELISMGHHFCTKTDTEVILHAYVQWGEACFLRLRGMWALAIYDSKNDKLVLSRDRFGIKPLYYVFDNGCLYFASEIPALFAAGIKAQANLSRVVAFLMVDISESECDTFFAGIKQLKGGTNLIFNLRDMKFQLKQFYDLKVAIDSVDTDAFDEEYYRTIRQHLRSDVKVGCCLSGGLDSSTLAAVAQQELDQNDDKKMVAVTAKSEDHGNDESNFAQMVVEHTGMDWEIAYPRYVDFVHHHKDMIKMHGEPVGGASVFMQFWVMKKAKETGIKVMLDGQGGDEILLGYERYYICYLLSLLKNGSISDFISSYRMIEQNSKLTMSMLLRYCVYFMIFPVRKAYLSKRMKYVQKKWRYLFFEKYKYKLKVPDDVRSLQVEEIVEGHLSSLLRFEDRSSMYFSIETRVPYVDHVLVEKALALRTKEKIHAGWTKYRLRKICEKVLPAGIAWRKNKCGFEAPEKIWLERYVDEMQKQIEKSDLLKEILIEIPDLRKMPLRERWRLYNVAVWEDQYLQGAYM